MGPDLETVGELGRGLVTPEERVQANARWDKIVGDMWEQY